MKQFKQLAALFLAFALVIGLFSVPTVAYAEETLTKTDIGKNNEVQVDYTKEEITVQKAANQTIYYTTKWTAKSHAKTNWDEAFATSETATGASIDFSNTAATKDVIFYITDDTAKEPYPVTIKAQEKDLVVAFSGVAKTTASSKIKLVYDWSELNELTAGCDDASTWSYGFLCAAVKNDNKQMVALSKEQAQNYLQFRKGISGVWKSITELDVRKFAANGAQLYFRIAPTNTATASGSALDLGRASKEVKVTFAKQANAPKVTINGATKEIKLGKTMEYRVGTTSGGVLNFGTNEWVAVSAKHMEGTKVKTTYLGDLLTATSGSAWGYKEFNAGQVVQVRVAATEKAVASKIRTIVLNKVETPVVTSSSLVFELVKDTTYDQGIKVTNNCTSAAIQVAVVSGAPTDINCKDIKWTTIAAKGDKTKTVTIKGKALEGKDRILYRFATVKDKANTTVDEFMVSSNYGTYDFKTELPLKSQSITISSVKKTVGPDAVVVSHSAIATGQALVEVKNPVTAAAITVEVNVAGTNISDSANVTVECISALNDSATKVTPSTVKLAADGKIGTSGKLKLTLTDAVAAGDSYFRVKVDGYKFYVQVKFSK